MNYNFSFPEMDRLAQQVKSSKADISLAQMREQVALFAKKLSGK